MVARSRRERMVAHDITDILSSAPLDEVSQDAVFDRSLLLLVRTDYSDFYWLALFALPLPTKHLKRQHYTCGISGKRTRTNPCGQKSTTRLSCEWLSVCNGFRPDFPIDPRIYSSKERRQFEVLTACAMRLRQ